MRVVKEYVAGKVRTYICIRFAGYAHTFETITELVEIAKKDFPTVLDKNINVQQYGGKSFKHTFGIEFPISEGDEIPEGYKEIQNMHMTL